MKNKLTALVFILSSSSYAQNVGIGTSTPDAKIDILQTSTSSAAQVNHQGTLGNSIEVNTTSSANTSSALYMRNASDGIGIDLRMNNNTTNKTGLYLQHSGNGTGIDVRMNNNTTNKTGLYVEHSGSGDGAYINQTNNGRAMLTRIGSSTNTSTASVIANFGLGKSLEIYNFNFSNNSTLAYYENFGRGTAFTGIARPQSAFLAAGTRVTANYLAYLGPDNGQDHLGSFSQSYPNQGIGTGSYNLGGNIGCKGEGGNYGVVGICQRATSLTSSCIHASGGDVTANGSKLFMIDHPSDPENKVLRHFSIESNEVLNMYRGVVKLSNNGEAIVELPEYFGLINKNFSYQLTPIGTPQTPYILEEIENNQFKIAGKPNSQVSWVVIATRNDLYYQKYPERAVDVAEKPEETKGTYFMPELYNMPASKGTFTSYIAPQKETSLTPDEILIQNNFSANNITD